MNQSEKAAFDKFCETLMRSIKRVHEKTEGKAIEAYVNKQNKNDESNK